MKKILFMWLMLLTVGISGFAQSLDTIIIGTGTSAANTLPFNNYYKNSWAQMIYPASQINESGYITSISFQVSAVPSSNYPFSTLTIYMGIAEDSVNATTSSWLPLSDLTEVYSATNLASPTATGWQTFVLNSPFPYDGSGHLVIVTSKTMATYSSALTYKYTTGATGCCLYRQNDSDASYANHPGTNTGTKSANRPNLRLTINPSSDFCYAVTNLTVTNLTSTDAVISWSPSNSTAVNYILQYKTSSQSWANATSVDVYDTAYDLTGMLTSSTDYNVRVATNCGGDTSVWKSLSFLTPCSGISTLPFFENFDSHTGNTSTTASTNNLPYCWSYLNNGTSTSYSGCPYIYSSTASAASGSNCLRFYTYITSGTYDDQIAILPAFDPVSYPVSTLQLSFDARANSTSYMFNLVVGVMSNPNDKTTFVAIDTISTQVTSYQNYEIPLSMYTGTGQYIALMVPQPTSGYNYGYVDNIMVDLLPTCPKPQNLTSSNPTLTSIDLSWLETGTASMWDIEYGPTGFTLGTGTVESVSSNPYTLNGLNHSTVYDFYVKADCGGGDTSNYSIVHTAGTECEAIATIPFTENFDNHIGSTSASASATNLPYCWNIINAGTSTSYSGCPYIYSSTATAASGSNSLHFYTYSTSGTYDDQIVVLPRIDITTYPINTLELSFDARTQSATYPFVMVAGVMTDPTDKATFVAIDTFRTFSSAYVSIEVPLSLYTGAGEYIAIMVPKPSIGYNYGYIDNIKVDYLSSCPVPQHVTASNATTTSIDLSWVETGSATSWEIEYGPMGFTPGDGTTMTANTVPFTINGLTGSTGYDFYVRANCGSDYSSYTLRARAATACAPIELPYFENFDAYDPNTLSNVESRPYCWSKINTGSSYSALPNIYTSATYAASGSNSLRFYTYTTSGTYDDQIAVLPQIDITTNPINTLQMNLDVRDYSTSYTFRLMVGVMTDPADKTTFTPVDTIISSVTTYSNHTVDFSNYSGTGSYIALMAQRPTSGYQYGQVDNILVEVIPTCQRPTALTATSSPADSVYLSWTDTEGSLWDVVYGPTGFDPDDPNVATVEYGFTTTSCAISGLSAGVVYDFYVRTDCGSGDVSEWTTQPAIGSPYTYIMGITGSDTVTACGMTITDDGGANGNYSNNCHYTLVIYPSESDSTLSISGTFIGESTLDYLEIYNGVGTNAPEPMAHIVSGTSGNVILFGPYVSTAGPLTLLFHSDVSAVYAGFVASVTCVEPPTCAEPYNLHLSDISNEDATLEWEVYEAAAMGYTIALSTHSSFNPDTCSNTFTTYDTTYQLTGLTPNTNYYISVQSNCGSEQSAWSNVYSFQTACDPLTTIPLTENFDGVQGSTSATTNNLPSCWKYLNHGTSTTYAGCPHVYSSSSYSQSGNNSLRFYTYTTSGTYDDQIAILPLVDPVSYPVNTLQLSFGARNYSTYTFTLVVGIMSNPSDKTTFEPIDTIVTTSNTYANYEIPFSLYTGTGNYVALMAPRPSTSYNAGYVDNIVLGLIPSCPKPINFTATSVLSNSVELSWVEVGSATAWEIEYGAPGFTPGGTAGTVENVTNEPPFTITGLNPSTSYDIYLRADCGSEYSTYAQKITVTTACASIDSLPFVEGFDTYGTGEGHYPSCWGKINTYTSDRPYVSATHYGAGVGSLYFYAGTSGTYNIAVTPPFDATIPVNTMQASFKYRANYASDRLIVGVMTNPADASTFVPVDTILPGSSPTAWGDRYVFFTQYTGSGQYIAFKNDYTTTYGYAYIDSLVIDILPTCPKPSQLHVVNSTTTSIELGWTENGSATSWILEYGPAGFTPGNGTVDNISTNPYTIDNLNPSTVYEFYLMADCGSENSGTAPAFSASTECAAINALPYVNNFDSYGTGTSSYPLCWSKLNTYSSTNYPYINSTNYSSPGALYFYSASASTYNIAILPEMDASIPINTLQATFMYRASNATSRLIVGVMTNPADANTFTPVDTVVPSASSVWEEFEIPFSQYTGTGHYIAFKNAYNTATSYGYLDNLSIDLIPTCPKPHDVTIMDATTTSIELGWTEVGSATTWEIAYGAPGFDPDGTTATLVTATSNPFTVTNLVNSNTYDFYVRALCSSTDVSPWSNKASGSTTMLPVGLPYTADFTDPSDAWVLSNGSCVNYWVKGTINGEGALFVTDNGTTPSYTITSFSVVAAQKLFTVGTSDSITITFDVRVDGEGSFDYLKLFLAPAAEQFLPATSAPSGTYGYHDYSNNAYNFYANSYGTQSSHPYVLNKLTTDSLHVVAKMPNPNTTPTSTSTALLVFAWKNDNSAGTQPPAIIKNVTVTADGSGPVVTDPTVATNPASNIAQTSATLNGTITNPDNVTITAKGFEWKTTTGGTYTQVPVTGSNLTYNLSNLAPSTSYTYKAYITFNGTTVYGSEQTFTTLDQGVEPCDVPTGLHTTDIQNESISIAWDANPNVNSWNIQYKPVGGQLSSASSNTNSYTITGLTGLTNYDIQVQAVCANGTSDWTSAITVQTTNVGIANWLENSVTLYPNPAREYVDIRVNGDVNVTAMEVFDVYGKLINTISIIDNPTRINVSSLANGMYFVRVTTEQGVVTKQFVKR